MADPYHADHNQGQWHFLPFLAADVRTQMAMDTELAEYCERGGDTAFVRLYRMDPPGITIGRNQRWRSVIDEKQCALEGWDWMRRPTGGGALLHRAEINYAVVAPRVLLDPKESASFRPAFERILAALSAVIRNLGFTPTVCLGRRGEDGQVGVAAHGLCVQSRTRFEIIVNGQKAVAAAHRNFSRATLQHGTLYRCAPTEHDRFWPEVEGSMPATGQHDWFAFGSSLPDPSTHLEALAGRFKSGFETTFGVPFFKSNNGPVNQEKIQDRLELWMNEDWRTRR